MSQEPPAPPQVSADGRFYWDGQRWLPMPASGTTAPAAPPAPSRRSSSSRNLAIGCAVVIMVVLALVIIGALSGGSHSPRTLDWSVDGRHTGTSVVGGSDAFQVTVTDNGPGASQLILYLNSQDDWFKHHVITDPDVCTINRNLERLECGPIKSGETRTINIAGSPKDAGNFNFAVDVADEEGGSLFYPKLGELTWSEAITP